MNFLPRSLKILNGILRSRITRSFIILLYLCLVFLWFKDNFHQVRGFKISVLFPFIPLSFLLLIKISFYLSQTIRQHRLAVSKGCWILILILIFAFSIRLPLLIDSKGMIDSDDAVMALMGKHIADGKVPPVSYYGQHRLGSLLSHFLALSIVLFGYSVSLLRFCSLVFFLGFICIQFLLLRRIFSHQVAAIGCLTLSLPIGHLIKISLDLAAGFSIVLFLGSLIIYLAYLIYYHGRDELTLALSFIMGLAFWSHQMSISFIATAVLFLFFKHRFHIHKYLPMVFFFVVGSFPFMLYEIFTKFATSSILFSGEKFSMSYEKINWFIKTIGHMLSSRYGLSNVLLFLLILFGIAIPIYSSLKNRKFLSSNVYTLFSIVFLLIYFSSAYSNSLRIRYLFPLYFSLPLLLFLPFFYLQKKAPRYALSFFLIFFMLVPHNTHIYRQKCRIAHEESSHLEEVINFLKKTKQKFWLSNYWNAYVLTALSKEDVYVVSSSHKRYLPYQLMYHQKREKTNYIFRVSKRENVWQANILRRLLKKFGIKHRVKKIHDFLMIYNINDWIPPFALSNALPDKFPEIHPVKIQKSVTHWTVIFQVHSPPKISGFQAYMSVPKSFTVSASLEQGKKTVKIEFPIPEKKMRDIYYYIGFAGILIKDSRRPLNYEMLSSEETTSKKPLLFLSGISSPVDFMDRTANLCSSSVQIQINEHLGPLSLCLYSPFDFKSPLWYGNYEQIFFAYLNGKYLGTFRLKDKENRIILPLKNMLSAKDRNILSLRFKYFLPVMMMPVGPWDTSAFLLNEKMDLGSLVVTQPAT